MEIYLDVLIGLNLYITYALLCCCELLGHFQAKPLRKGLSALLGGLSALLILWPELGAATLTALRLGLAAVLTLIAFGYGGAGKFWRRVGLFFLVNFLFAGVMIACWLVFTPPGMAIRNGVVYFHLSALTMVAATIAASLAVKGLSALFWQRKPEALLMEATLTADGRETALRILLDTGNRLALSGVPVVVCSRKSLAALLPAEFFAAADDLAGLSGLSGSSWGRRIRLVPCETAAGKKLLPAFRPDSFTRSDGERLDCFVAVTDGDFGDADGAAPEELWKS